MVCFAWFVFLRISVCFCALNHHMDRNTPLWVRSPSRRLFFRSCDDRERRDASKGAAAQDGPMCSKHMFCLGFPFWDEHALHVSVGILLSVEPVEILVCLNRLTYGLDDGASNKLVMLGLALWESQVCWSLTQTQTCKAKVVTRSSQSENAPR